MVRGDVAGAGQGVVSLFLGTEKVPRQEQNGVSILLLAPYPLGISQPS